MKGLRARAEEARIKAEAKDRYIQSERIKRASDKDYISKPTITEFYRGANVFITGGTGFVGKVLTEKLLRSCTDIERIYFLVREKKGKSPEDRVADLLKSQLFEKVLRENPSVVRKVVPIVGDIAQIGLGLSEDDRMLLQHTTTVVFHAAATVRFDEPFTNAVLLNCRGTREVVELCKSMHRLKAMVHVSTTYCNTDRAIHEEIVYPAHLHWRDVIKVAETDDPGNLQCLSDMLIGKLPNIYTFTKRVAENIVNDARHQIPVIIGRPSVVIATVSDPVEGWWDNMMGPPGMQIGVSTGVLRIFYANPDVEMDYFAADYVIRELILISWIRGTGLRINPDPDAIDVVNMSVQDCYEATLSETMFWYQEIIEYKPPLGFRRPNLTFTQNRLYFMYRLLTSHVLFSIILDVMLSLLGKELRLLKIYRRVQTVNNAVKFFATQKYKSIPKQYYESIAFLKEEDIQHFGQTIAFDFFKYTLNAEEGVNKYLLKKTPDYERNGRVQRLLVVIHWIWQGLKFYAVYWLLRRILWKDTNPITTLSNFMTHSN